MARLIPLADIPYSARARERQARKAYGSRAAALAGAQFEIVSAPGCHSRPSFDPPSIGWVCSRVTAEALAARLTHMPDGTSHRRLAFEFRG
jgi:hypothetical protein